ncbi:Pinin/SDK/MemA protein [Metarhizium album ARSEF 1941]|uniref:Pinin/SDK/MemA protein n=1 Tax=Metarhizium album (strain ARSEF 1941) TaxID=1081103 RepID=A0A0B2X1A8_METAS|nr:Pinin/SDK/MemA protein [Metarhizium album ARSEF 1941]KHN99462.1 Pinin/SDK/MemA protein [Metarhizium album ARSEF 1941]
MATETIPPAVGGSPTPEDRRSRHEDVPLKRKASLADDDGDSSFTKRQRQDDDGSPPRRRPPVQETAHERRASATQEEKKRGKRLFGGLLSTLSQTSTNSQHKRRQEIERKQQERIQKQRDEEDKKRADKVARIKETRIVQQIDFEEQVMRNKHSKLLALAEFLKTKSQPSIYYLPWKRSADQEDLIDDQVRSAKATIAKEEEEFKTKKERHLSRYQPRRLSSDGEKGDAMGGLAATDAGEKHGEGRREQELVGRDEDKSAHHDDPHDESGDVVVEADEDTVIY